LPRGDYKAGFLQAVLAIVAPAAVFHPGAVDGAALIDARLWEGSAVWQNTKAYNDPHASPEFIAASPEAFSTAVPQQRKEATQSFPLCAASDQAVALQGNGPGSISGPAELEREERGRNLQLHPQIKRLPTTTRPSKSM